MIAILLGEPDSPYARRDKITGEYCYGLYRRERVVAVSQTPEALMAKKRWDERIRGWEPLPGWTMRLRDIGQPLGINSIAVGRLLNLMGLRAGGRVSDLAVAAELGVRRWDGERFFTDWNRDRVVEAIKSAVAGPDRPEVADAFRKAVPRQKAKERLAERRRQKEEVEAAKRGTREAVVDRLRAELKTLMASGPDMLLLDAVEFVTPDSGDRLELYRAFRNAGLDQVPEGSSPIAGDLAQLKRPAEVMKCLRT